MKKIIIAFSIGFLFTQTLTAQGALGKLKEKVGQTTSSLGADKCYTGWPLGSESQGKKDLENTKLDVTTFAADQWGISGIYVSQKPLGVYSEYEKLDATIQKFAVTISPDGKEITLNHSAESKVFSELKFIPKKEGGESQNTDAAMRSKGLMFNMAILFETTNGTTVSYVDSTDYDGKTVKRGVVITSGYVSMLEPGVFVFHPYATSKNGATTCDGGSKLNGEEEELKYNPFNLIYKKGKDISKWTDAAILKELFRQSDMYCQLKLNAETANVEMPSKIAKFKDEPSNADLLKTAQQRAKDFGWKETITTVYPTSSWSNVIELKGNQALETLTGRTMWVIAIMKTPKGECAIEYIGIKQDNAYTVGSQQEFFNGKPIYHYSNGDLKPIDCSKIK